MLLVIKDEESFSNLGPILVDLETSRVDKNVDKAFSNIRPFDFYK